MENIENIKIDDYIKILCESDTTVVFTFGYIGAGKTCFLSTLYQYLFENYSLKTNPQYNSEGLGYIQKHVKQIQSTKNLPPSTSADSIHELDLGFRINGKNLMFTFLDLAGEDLKMVNPDEIHSVSKKKSDCTLDEKINRFLSEPNLPVILLCLIDSDKAEEQNRHVHNFFNYLVNFYNFDISRVSLIISKWDKYKDNKLSDFVEKNIKQSKIWLEEEVTTYASIFPFSIGNVSDDGNKLNSDWDLKYCREIVDWLYKTSNIQRKKIESKKGADDFKDEELAKTIITETKSFVKTYWKDIVKLFRN